MSGRAILHPPPAAKTPLTWHGLTAAYSTEEREMMRGLAAAVEEGREDRRVLEFVHECKARFGATIGKDAV